MKDKIISASVQRATDLESLIQVICKLNTVKQFDFDQFQSEYEKVSKRKVSKKTAEDYLYSATTWGLVVSKQYGYEVNKIISNILCLYLRENDYEKLKEVLFNIIRSKVPVFLEFLNLLRDRPTLNALRNMFRSKHTLGTILKWGRWLDVVARSDLDGRYYLVRDFERTISLEEFWNVFQEVYEELRRTGLAGIRSAFVKIHDLREEGCSRLGISRDRFNHLLFALLDQPKYRKRVELSGAPLSFIESEEKKGRAPIKFNNKIYYFIAMKSGE